MKNSKSTINTRQQQLLEYLMKNRNCDNNTLSDLLNVTPISLAKHGVKIIISD